jgi:hypothetical protein
LICFAERLFAAGRLAERLANVLMRFEFFGFGFGLRLLFLGRHVLEVE